MLALCAACAQPTATPAPTATVTPVPPTATATATPAPPTATPVPLAARVNGQEVPLAEYAAERQRCEAAQAYPDCGARVLQALVEQTVVEQAARAAGLTIAEAEVQAELDAAQQALGGPEAYTTWLAANGYTAEAFKEAVRRDLLRARQAERVMASVGEAAEQVHAQVILVAEEALARSLLEQVRAGAEFGPLAVANSLDASTRAAGGDLGWFPRGWLTEPAVEQAAFALQPGELSEVVATEQGYYVLQVLERDPVRARAQGARQALRARAYRIWLETELAQAAVELLINP